MGFIGEVNVPSLPFQTPNDQVKIGGQNVSSMLTGKTVMAPSGSLESRNFVAGTSGFQLTGAGAAEFNSITVRGTIIGTFKTAASGQRIEILSSSPSLMTLYSGNGAEVSPASLGLVDAGAYPQLTMTNAVYTNGVAQRIDMTEPVGSRRAITIEGGKPAAGSRGWVYLQPSGTPEGKVMIREGGAAPVKNMGTTVAGNTLVGGAPANTEASPLPNIIASTESVTFAAVTGKGSITLPASGFANGILAAVVVGVVGSNSVLVTVDPATTKTVLKLYAWDTAGAGAAYAGTEDVSYICIGW